MNKVGPDQHNSVIEIHESTNTRFYKPELHTDSLDPNGYVPTKPSYLKSERQESLDKCGRKDGRMMDGCTETTIIWKNGVKDINIPESLKVHLDSFNSRLERMEKAFSSENN